MSGNIFKDCQDQLSGDGDGSGNDTTALLLQCISDTIQENGDARAADLHDFLYVMAGAMIFFMQSGFAMLCAGSVRLKNVQNTMLKNLLDACGAALAFYLVGKFLRIRCRLHGLRFIILWPWGVWHNKPD